MPAPDRDAWPRVSVIIPACNEAPTLEGATRSRLADDYPSLELVLLNDRSTDETPAIVDRLAASDARVRPVHITALPEGWLGKLHAMHRGVEAARGEWLLFTDADVSFAPGTLRRVIDYCETRGVDHLSLMPQFDRVGFAVDAAIDVFARILTVGGRLWAVPDPRSRAAVGGGLFNLVRRSVYDRSEGFAWLRLEVGDDVALGQMLKRRAGARADVVHGGGMVSLPYYDSLAALAEGMEKNAFAVVGGYSHARTIALCALMLVTELGVFVAPLLTSTAWVRAVSCAGSLLALATMAAVLRWMGRPLRSMLLAPAMTVFLAGCVLRSAWLASRRGGILWRGTLYPTALLRAHSRIEIL